MQGLTLGLRLQLLAPCTHVVSRGQAWSTTHAATTLLNLKTFEEYPATWCLKITMTGWYIGIPCSRLEGTCCIVCLDKPNRHKFFQDLIKVIKIFILPHRQGWQVLPCHTTLLYTHLLCLQCHVFIFDSLYLVARVLKIVIHKRNYCIFFFHG